MRAISGLGSLSVHHGDAALSQRPSDRMIGWHCAVIVMSISALPLPFLLIYFTLALVNTCDVAVLSRLFNLLDVFVKGIFSTVQYVLYDAGHKIHSV